MFNLGRWVVVGALWAVLVIVVLTVPDVNNSTAYKIHRLSSLF